jgi:hypothetical protein
VTAVPLQDRDLHVLSRWEVRLAPVDRLGPVSVDAAHWLGCHWFDWTLDEHVSRKDYALGPPSVDGTGALVFSMRCLTNDMAHRLQARAIPGTRVRVGARSYRVCRPPRLLAVEPWSAIRDAPPAKRWRLTTVTPVTFTSGNRTSGWPVAATIVRGLLNRWPGVVDVEAEMRGLRDVHVRDGDGRTRTVRLDRITNCFEGWVDLTADSPATRARLAPLMAFAAYSGIGAATAWGFGTVTVTPHR